MPKIAHISDVHFGGSFDVAVWKNVRTRIEEFKPDVLIVSGDLVDHPWPFRLLAVKAELMDLCATCTSKPELFVVPGNHDVRLWGNVRLRLWPRWLERIVFPEWFEWIMFNDTTEAIKKVGAALGIPLGLNNECKKLKWAQRFRRLDPENSLRSLIKKDQCDKRLQSCDRRRAGVAWPTASLHSRFEIVCFDSNPGKGRGRAFAAGEVGQDQITRLNRNKRPTDDCPSCKTKLSAAGPNSAEAVLLRVAVLHHHPLPIALDAESFRAMGQQGKLEPYLLLRNAGDLLQQLQKGKFDLVLHGHKHRPQFARLELNADGLDPYPLTVLAGGSTAKDNESKADNTLRLIETEPNGRLVVRTVERGEAWPQDDEPYREDLPKLKQRAFSRARERTKRTVGLLRWEIEIDAIGNVSIKTKVEKFRLLSGAEAVKGFPILTGVPAHGQRFDKLIELDPEFEGAMSLKWRAENTMAYDLDKVPQGQAGYCWIELKQQLEPGSPRTIDYGFQNWVSNSIAMNSWERAERARIDPRQKDEYESVARYVAFPADRLQLRLKLPEDLGKVRPEFRCSRAPRYPEFPLTYDPAVAIEVVKNQSRQAYFRDEFDVDDDIRDQELHKLRYDPLDKVWKLDIDYPVPGYFYELRWKVPLGDIAEKPVRDGTNVRQDMLLDLRGRLVEPNAPAPSGVDGECCDLFSVFARALMRDLAGPNRAERQAVFLMVYDRKNLALYPVRACVSEGVSTATSFNVPLGRGIAGAAFLQNKVLTWGKSADSRSLIVPEHIPGIDPEYVLALPVFYLGQREKLVAKTGAVIGVVTVASDSVGSKIPECKGETPEAIKRRTELQLAAQGVVMEILRRLSRGYVPPPAPDTIHRPDPNH